MSAAYSEIKKFTVNNVEFYHYYAQDAHGSKVNNYMVDGRTSTLYQWRAALLHELSPHRTDVLFALGGADIQIPDWSHYVKRAERASTPVPSSEGGGSSLDKPVW
jgi:hypothetical protein